MLLFQQSIPEAKDPSQGKSSITPAFAGFDLTKLLTGLTPSNVIDVTIKSQLDSDEFLSSLNTMETQVTNLALKFGGNREMVDQIKSSLEQAIPSVKALGGSVQDVVDIQQGVIKGLQTQTILDKDAYKDIYSIGTLIGDGSKTNAETTAKLVSEFKNAGFSLYEIGNQMTEVIGDAREVGAATSAVYKQLSENMGKLNLYNFENGVKGMAQMAADAAVLRLNMGDTLKIADKLFNPEDAIQMAADMQRLGVQVTNLLDPYKLMDMARNDPQELQKSIYEAASALTYFDEKNKKISILPGEQGRLRELAKAFGMTAEEFAKIAVNYGDMERKMKEIKFSPFVTEEKDQKFLASIAELKDGKYQVNMGWDEDTQTAIMKPVDQLTDLEVRKLQKMEGDKKKSSSELIIESNNQLVNINNQLEAMRGILPRRLAASTGTTALMRTAGEMALPLVGGIQKGYGIDYMPGGKFDMTEFNKQTTEMFKSTKDIVSGVASGKIDMKDAAVQMEEVFKNSAKEFAKRFKNFPTTMTEYSKEMKKRGVVSEAYDYTEVIPNFMNGLIKSLDELEKDPKYKTWVQGVKNLISRPFTQTQTQPTNQTLPPTSAPPTNTLPLPSFSTQQPANQLINNLPSPQTILIPNLDSSLVDMTEALEQIKTEIESSRSESKSQMELVEKAPSKALNYFENPGTLKMTLYGEKVGIKDLVEFTTGKKIGEEEGGKKGTKVESEKFPEIKNMVELRNFETFKPILEMLKIIDFKTFDTKEKENVSVIKEMFNSMTKVISSPTTERKTTEISKESFKEKSETSENNFTDVVKNMVDKISQSAIGKFEVGTSNITGMVPGMKLPEAFSEEIIKNMISKYKQPEITESTNVAGMVPGMKLPESFSEDILNKIISKYFTKEAKEDITGLTPRNKIPSYPMSDLEGKKTNYEITNSRSEILTKLVTDTKMVTDIIPKLFSVGQGTNISVSPTLPKENMKEPVITTTDMTQTKTKTSETPIEGIDVSGTIKLELPSNLPPILDMALNNPIWIENLKRQIVKSVIDRRAMFGTGNYSENSLGM